MSSLSASTESTGRGGEIAAADLREAESLIGILLRRPGHNRTVTRPAISRWARSIGDRNPLWLDADYGPNSSAGATLTPPCWLYSVDDTCLAVKFPGLHVLYGGTDWTFSRPVALGDCIESEARITDIEEKSGRFCGPMVLQTGETVFRNHSGDEVARAVSRVFRTRREAAVNAGKYRGIVKAPLAVDQMVAIENAYDGEQIRGPEPRYWENLHTGDPLTPIVRGPLTSEEVVQFVAATRPSLGFARFTRHRRRHPGAAFFDPETGSWESWEASLVRDEVAQSFGFPFAHDAGIDRISWVDNLITNWMGDSGHLKSLSVNLTMPNVYGDVTWCRGRVSALRHSNGEHMATLDLWCENQRGETTAEGRATVSLPSKNTPSLRGSGLG